MSKTYNTILLPGQNIVDIAMQEYGSADALTQLCIDNDFEVGQEVAAGTQLILNDANVVDPGLVAYFKTKQINVASGSEGVNSPTAPIFTPILYGYLYNWYAAGSPLFAPAGWHIPSHIEWNTLDATLGGGNIGGGAMKEEGTTHWQDPNIGATNASGLTMLPGGYRNEYNGLDYTLGQYGIFWTSDIYSTTSIRTRTLRYNTTSGIAWSQNAFNKGLSVRLIKDDSAPVDSLIDIDGNVYPVLKIGEQVWLAANWACTKLNDGTPIPKVTDGTVWKNQTTMGMGAYNNDENNVKAS